MPSHLDFGSRKVFSGSRKWLESVYTQQATAKQNGCSENSDGSGWDLPRIEPGIGLGPRGRLLPASREGGVSSGRPRPSGPELISSPPAAACQLAA
jgi:hypothetical protein